MDEDQLFARFAGPADEPADLLIAVEAAIQLLRVAHAGFAVDLPAVDLAHLEDIGGVLQGLRRDRQLAAQHLAEEAGLLLRTDGEAGAEPGLGQAVMFARIAGEIPIAVVEAVDILLEALHPQPFGDLLGKPDHRVGFPAARGGGFTPGGQPAVIARFVGQCRMLFINQIATVVTHQRQRDLEGGRGRQLAGAVPFAGEGLAVAVSIEKAAAGGGGRQGCEQTGSQQAGEKQAGHSISLSKWMRESGSLMPLCVGNVKLQGGD